MDPIERLEGVRATLRRLLQAERDATGRESAWVQWGDIEGEDWAKELTQDQALELVYLELEENPDWYIVGRPVLIRNETLFQGASFTDEAGHCRVYLEE